MAQSPRQQAAAAADQSKGLPRGFKAYSPFPFAGMNQQDGPHAIADQEFTYNENFILVGKGQLRTAWDVGSALYNAPAGKKIVSFFFYDLGGTNGIQYYVAVFLNDGSAVQVNVNSGVQTIIGPAATFYNAATGFAPAFTQWSTLYLLISNRNSSNDYWAWDGSTLYTAGTAAPQGVTLTSTGQNYSSAPTVTAFGGAGSGMTFSTVENAGGVVQVAITNPGSGYQAGDVVQLQFTGGGSDTGPELTASLNAGGVAAVNITNAGSGYTHASVGFSGGGGSGAAATAIIGAGVASVTMTNTGSGYTVANVGFSGGTGSGAIASANIVGGQVVSITIINPGAYTVAPTVTITGDGSSAAGTAVLNTGQVIGITVNAAGSGYTSAPTVSISGDGTAAAGQAILGGSGVNSVAVVNGGSGFTYAPNISFAGGGGSGATGIATLTGTSIQRVSMVSGGANYQKPPTISFTGGGSGSGAAATAVMGGGQVIAINVTNAGSGYTQNVEVIITPQKGDTGTGAGAVAVFAPTSISGVIMSSYGINYTSAPAVVVAPGANHSAYATVSLMPFGVSGDGIETFESRVWILDQQAPSYIINKPGPGWMVSAPGSFTDFATSDGGALFTNSDSFLQAHFSGVKQANGYLYFFGDGSVSVVSNVNTGGSPNVTTFNYQNADPQRGLTWRDTLLPFGRTLLFGNQTGVYGLYGGAATKVSAKLDQFFNNALFPPNLSAVTPSSACATIFNMQHYLMLITTKDPDTGVPRTVMVTWNEKEWVLTSQSVALTYIGTQKIQSTFTAWGTDGNSLYPLFNKPSTTLTKHLDTKVYGADQMVLMKDLFGLWINAQDQSSNLAGVSFVTELELSGLATQSTLFGSVPNVTSSTLFFTQPNFQCPPPYWPTWGTGTGGAPFCGLHMHLHTSSPDFILGNLLIGYSEIAAKF